MRSVLVMAAGGGVAGGRDLQGRRGSARGLLLCCCSWLDRGRSRLAGAAGGALWPLDLHPGVQMEGFGGWVDLKTRKVGGWCGAGSEGGGGALGIGGSLSG